MTKKLILSISYLMLNAFVYAQQSTPTLSDYKPKKGSVVGEGIISNIANGPAFNTYPITEYGLKFRYFLKDNLAVRIHFGEANHNIVTYLYDPNDDSKNGTIALSNSYFSILLGVEKHFTGTDRLSTYALVDLGYTCHADNVDVKDGDPATSKYLANSFFTAKIAESGLTLKLGTGADYYISKKLYLGAELGLRMILITHYIAKNSSIDPTINIDQRKDYAENKLSTGFAPSMGFRIGYAF